MVQVFSLRRALAICSIAAFLTACGEGGNALPSSSPSSQAASEAPTNIDASAAAPTQDRSATTIESGTDSGFDYHGVKSGMTRSEVKVVMGLLGGRKEDIHPSNDYESWTEFGNIPVPPNYIEFKYDHSDRLYVAALSYDASEFDDDQASALKAVLKEKYGAVIAGSPDFSSGEKIKMTLIDNRIFEQSVEHYKTEYMKNL